MSVRFRASEYHADTAFAAADYEFEGSESEGWTISRNGAVHLKLGAGYRLLETERCGVCSTDLDRHFLPFPLPQITGHELVALDARAETERKDAKRYVVEINASHSARGVASDCAFCARGLSTHCPERLVLGIHDLPGGFGPWILAPKNAILEVPDEIPTEVAVLVEPFAATLRGVHVTAPRAGDRVAVLGPRRLGMLLVAALAAERRRRGIAFEIHALVRRPELGELAQSFGADGYEVVDSASAKSADFDIVFDTTGNPDALAVATQRAAREVHIKSTHGRESCGLTGLTAMVVDELAIGRLPIESVAQGGHAIADSWQIENFSGALAPTIAWLSNGDVPSGWKDRVLRAERALDLRDALEKLPGLPRADAVVVDAETAAIDAAIRPTAEDENSILRPRGTIWLDPRGAQTGVSPLVDAVTTRGLRFSTSRCGDFRAALDLLANDAELRASVARLVTHSFEAPSIDDAFRTARSKECIKAVIHHDTAALPRD